MMELVKVPLQRSGQKAAETCSLHCTGLTPKLLAQISMPQMFKLWSCHWRTKGGRVWQPAQAQQVKMSRPPATRLEDTKWRICGRASPPLCCPRQWNILSPSSSHFLGVQWAPAAPLSTLPSLQLAGTCTSTRRVHSNIWVMPGGRINTLLPVTGHGQSQQWKMLI